MNRTQREEAIGTIVLHFIDDGTYGEPGKLMDVDPDFAELYTMVAKLWPMGRTARWHAGIQKWIDTIEYARKTFCDENGFSVLNTPTWKDCTFRTQRAYTELFKWAVSQGAIYAGYGA
jgi:hypothetical protein